MAEQVAELLAPTMEFFSSGTTPEGLIVAYISLAIVAILAIIISSIGSVKVRKIRKANGKRMNVLSKTKAIFVLVLASAILYGFYMSFKIFPKDWINLLATGFFSIMGVKMLASLLNPVIKPLVPAAVPNKPYCIQLKWGRGRNKRVNFKFYKHDIVCSVISSAIGIWYLLKEHWIANNILGLAIAVNGIEILHLNDFFTGCIFLSGCFFYDIFCVFGTNVMVTVAMNLKAPLNLMFPQDLFTDGLNVRTYYSMLGIGDIIIPGMLIALLLRFDRRTRHKSRIYFRTTLIAYFLGLIATIFAMHVFKHRQPALFYLVPACLGTPIIMAMLRGELKKLFDYEDYPENH